MAEVAKKRNRARSWFAGVLLVIASLILPTAIVGHWATTQISNSNQFVDSLAPLSANPEVQNLVIDKLSTTIEDQLHVDKTTQSLVDGIATSLKLPDPLKKTLNLLSAPIASGIEGLINDTVAKVVKSPAFQKAWTAALTLTHDELIAILSNKPGAAVSISADGTLSIQLKPLMAEVKKQLVAAHVPFAQAIPEVNTTIPIAKIPNIVAARVIYQVGVGVGTWLPWIVAAIFGASILLAVRRWRMVMITGIAVVVMTGLVALGLSAGKIMLTLSLNADISQVAGIVYDSVLFYAATEIAGVLTVGVVLALAGALLGLNSTQRLRSWFAKGFAKVRASMEGFGLNTGAFGKALATNRVTIRSFIVAVAILLVGISTPVNVTGVIATTLLVAGLLVAFEVLQRPVVVAPAAVVKKAVAKKAIAKKPAAKK
ncbi:MAG: hypothetical protein RLZZ600_224 [Actinomycetota bacterium]